MRYKYLSNKYTRSQYRWRLVQYLKNSFISTNLSATIGDQWVQGGFKQVISYCKENEVYSNDIKVNTEIGTNTIYNLVRKWETQSTSDRIYKNKGWVNWSDWLGK